MAHTIRIESSDRRFTASEQETILDAALRQGITLPYSCRNGSCATCKAVLREGSVDYGVYEQKALPDVERAAGKVLLCQARALSDVVIQAREIETPPGISIRTLPCRVIGMQRAAHDVMILRVKLPDNPPFAFLAGQYVEFLLKDNQRRSFSIAGTPKELPFLELHVRHVPGGVFTGHVFDGMQERDLLRLRGPLGTFFLRPTQRPIVMVAGGTGFAPIKAMIEDMIEKRIDRPVHLYWGVRSRRDLYHHALAESWTGALPHFRYTPVLSEPMPDDEWTGRTGFVHEAVAEDYKDLAPYEVYASGPPPMVEALKHAAFAQGLSSEQMFYDSFEFAHAAP